jgi:hypothetical protein
MELDNVADRAVKNLGGRYGETIELPERSATIVWCETGVVVCDLEGRFRWQYETGIVDELRAEDGVVVIETGATTTRLRLSDGKTLSSTTKPR